MSGRTALTPVTSSMAVRCCALGVALLLSSSCAQSGRPLGTSEPFADARSEEESQITLFVQNFNFSDARLFTIRRGGARRPLGRVGGKGEERFRLEWPMSEPLRIEIDLLAGPTCITRDLVVDPGDTLELQISAVFTQTAACRR